MHRNDRKYPGRSLLLLALLTPGVISLSCKHPEEDRTENSGGPTSAISATTAPTQPAGNGSAAPAAALVDYQDKGAHFQYPNTWKPKTDKDYELHLIPAGGEAGRDITFDIPDLPPHFPGMIRLGLIESGYIDDLKKNHPGLHVDSATDHAMADGAAKARLVESSWKEGDVTRHDVGLLIMRKDQVYIFSCDASDKDLAATRADFDKMTGAVRWDK
jgi:hypothetical protein